VKKREMGNQVTSTRDKYWKETEEINQRLLQNYNNFVKHNTKIQSVYYDHIAEPETINVDAKYLRQNRKNVNHEDRCDRLAKEIEKLALGAAVDHSQESTDTEFFFTVPEFIDGLNVRKDFDKIAILFCKRMERRNITCNQIKTDDPDFHNRFLIQW
jgi:hypothetical protein